jgi:hypothetical protein
MGSLMAVWSEERLDRFSWGVAAGLLASAFGFIAFGMIWSAWVDENFSYFYRVAFLGSDMYRDRIITISVLFCVPVFRYAWKRDMLRFARGIMLVLVASVPLIIWLQSL